MALSTATLTGDIADQLGNDFDNRRTKIWLTTNVPGQTIIDTSGDKIRLGSGNVTLASDGTFTAVVWVPGAGSNPASWQTTVHVDYPDRNATNGRAVKSFGPFTITANANLADLIAEMPVQPEYLATVLETVQDMIDEATGGTGPELDALADRLDGVNDHGDISGTVTLDPAKGFHIFDATGPLEVSLGNPPGYSLAFKAITGATNVTVDGLPDLTLTDDAWATFVHYRSSWHLAASGASGGGDVEPVTDPPTQPGAITVDPTADGYNLSWVASTVAAGYEVQIDGGTWVDSGANITHAYTGLGAGSEHSGSVRAYNSSGERSTGRAWGPATVDTMSLHDLILSMEPEIYVRLTEGEIEDYSRVPATWTAYNFYNAGASFVPTDFSGPPLTPGDTGSLVPLANTKVQRTIDGLLTGATAVTQMTVSGMKPDATTGGNGTGIYYGGSSSHAITAGQAGTESFQVHKPGGVHTWFSVWNPSGFGDNNIRRYIDGNNGAHSTVTGLGAAPLPAPSYPERLFMGGNEFGGDTMGGYSAYTVVWKRALTPDERVTLTTSAGTLNNPAGGTLTGGIE